MNTVTRFLNNHYVFWAILSIPAIPMLVALIGGDNPRIFHILVHPTGEFAARFLIITMMISPLMILLPKWRGPRWLMRRRRYIGVAAFGYAVAHTLFYLIDKGAIAVSVNELSKALIWTGWLAFLIFIPLAITSTDGWVRRLGTSWKPLQRWVYAAAALTLLHWAVLHNWSGAVPALVHFAPLIALQAYRVWWIYNRPNRARPKELASQTTA
ncbi:MAG: ferric reductase-like transmembrane domain-containing protein [Hyphomicrobiales bacterium]|nr:ferric reductase-like transmembrane domain-containing protein [Hyphomicrobiales bacterium]